MFTMQMHFNKEIMRSYSCISRRKMTANLQQFIQKVIEKKSPHRHYSFAVDLHSFAVE